MKRKGLNWQQRKAGFMKQDPLPPKTIKAMSPAAWRQALLACLDHWGEQKEEFHQLRKAIPEFVQQQAHPDWLPRLQTLIESEDLPAIQAWLEPAPHQLQIDWVGVGDASEVVVQLDGFSAKLSHEDYTYLYALAYLQQMEPEPGLYTAKRIYAQVQALFPQPENADSNEKNLRKAFETTLEQVLQNMESTLGKASGQRWRHLLMSQARRYATGIDDANSYELLSELRQHRDLLDLMIQRFEQQAGLKPLDTPAARLYRFFVSDPEALEIRHRLGSYVSKHLLRVYKALQAAQLQSKVMGCPEEVLWGRSESRLWQEATTQGYALRPSVKLEVVQPPAEILAVLATSEPSDEASDLESTVMDPAPALP